MYDDRLRRVLVFVQLLDAWIGTRSRFERLEILEGCSYHETIVDKYENDDYPRGAIPDRHSNRTKNAMFSFVAYAQLGHFYNQANIDRTYLWAKRLTRGQL